MQSAASQVALSSEMGRPEIFKEQAPAASQVRLAPPLTPLTSPEMRAAEGEVNHSNQRWMQAAMPQWPARQKASSRRQAAVGAHTPNCPRRTVRRQQAQHTLSSNYPLTLVAAGGVGGAGAGGGAAVEGWLPIHKRAAAGFAPNRHAAALDREAKAALGGCRGALHQQAAGL